MRKVFLLLVMMLCTLGMAFGQPNKAKPKQTAQSEAKKNSGKCDCSAKESKAAQQDSKGDPQAPQNIVEYGGGG